MAGTVGELFIELGVKGDAKKVEDFTKKVEALAKQFGINLRRQEKTNQGLSNMVKKLRNVSLAITATIYAVEKMTDALVKDNQVWMQFEQQTDLSLKTLQGYAGVASLFDKSLGMHGAAGSIQALQDKLFELQLTGEGARGFQIAGINPVGQNAFGVLEQVRERIKGLNDTSATYLLRQLGLDPKMLPMLRMERSEFERLRQIEERLTLTEEERAKIQELQMKREIAHQKLRLAQQRLMLALLPLWTKLTDIAGVLAESVAKVMRNFNKLNSGFKAVIIGTAGWLAGSKLLNSFLNSKILKTIAKLLGFTKKLKFNLGTIAKTALPAITAAFKSLLTVVRTIFAPLLAIYLLLEDFMVWRAGGKSVIGDFLNWRNNVNDAKNKRGISNINVGNTNLANPNNPRSVAAFEKLQEIKKLEDTANKPWWRGGNTTGDIEAVKANMLTSPSYYKQFGNAGNTVNNTTNAPVINQHNYITEPNDARIITNMLIPAINSSPSLQP